MVGTPEYKAWSGLIGRCTNTSNPAYDNYGARGIKVCERWLESFENFFEDMGLKLDESLSLDRIDVNGNYCKENCRWVNDSTQSFNRRRTKANSSGRTGVSLADKKYGLWKAMIHVDGKLVYLGCSKSFEEACRLREEAEIKYHGTTKE